MTQESFSSRRSETAAEQEQVTEAVTANTQDAGVDDQLDEIDGVLEQNAEEFVRGFVQKGDQ
jgi:ubiquitin-like protein Pup